MISWLEHKMRTVRIKCQGLRFPHCLESHCGRALHSAVWCERISSSNSLISPLITISVRRFFPTHQELFARSLRTPRAFLRSCAGPALSPQPNCTGSSNTSNNHNIHDFLEVGLIFNERVNGA